MAKYLLGISHGVYLSIVTCAVWHHFTDIYTPTLGGGLIVLAIIGAVYTEVTQ